MTPTGDQQPLVTDRDLAVRRLVYAHFGRTGNAMTRAELAACVGKPIDWVNKSFTRLASARVLVLGRDEEIHRALPFCAKRTPFVVRAGGVTYYGNCAWDAFGLAALFGASSEIALSCGDCGEPLSLQDDIVHVSVPAARWWDDIGRT